MQRYNILWADDEIDMLKPHIIFLEGKGANITPVNNGAEAIEKCERNNYDVVFLDENMPGMSGIETLTKIKAIKPNLPVVMITKSEEEHIMEEAIGAKIADYLIKPLNPNQILLSVKKILDNKRLVTEKTNIGFQQEFMSISSSVNDFLDYREWGEVYRKLIYWELEIDDTDNKSMAEVLENQKMEANANFGKFINDNYEDWLMGADSGPVLSHNLMREKVFPELRDGEPLFFLVIDNLRFDQWKIIEPLITEYFNIDNEDTYYSILPTTTAYSRNAIFSGLLPDEMEKQFPKLWVREDQDEGKNNAEEGFLDANIRRNYSHPLKFSYRKIKHVNEGKLLSENINNLFANDLNVIVYNFVDMLSHARTDMAMIRELAPDESAYRSITKSWFEHSPLLDSIRQIAEGKGRLIISTDHGTIRVKRPFKIVGDRNSNPNLRYKHGKNLNFKKGKIMHVTEPEKIRLPRINISTSYAFATEDLFFTYPNNFNYYANYFKDTFQHGGISMEEMIIPIISLSSKYA